jgi:general secretion pathway protein G
MLVISRELRVSFGWNALVLVAASLAGCVYDPLVPIEEHKIQLAHMQIQSFQDALRMFRSDTGRFPTSQEGLEALVVNPGVDGWRGPYLKGKIPKDPWGTPYGYTYPGRSPSQPNVFSVGADQTLGRDGR